ncbi:hypothetical protein BX600DRAFT_504713 [Xylariales sp. PMI_506]|nr:hypothetical protein BX600DRAFT_504713 [Xylariales sp. PMI_506]
MSSEVISIEESGDEQHKHDQHVELARAAQQAEDTPNGSTLGDFTDHPAESSQDARNNSDTLWDLQGWASANHGTAHPADVHQEQSTPSATQPEAASVFASPPSVQGNSLAEHIYPQDMDIQNYERTENSGRPSMWPNEVESRLVPEQSTTGSSNLRSKSQAKPRKPRTTLRKSVLENNKDSAQGTQSMDALAKAAAQQRARSPSLHPHRAVNLDPPVNSSQVYKSQVYTPTNQSTPSIQQLPIFQRTDQTTSYNTGTKYSSYSQYETPGNDHQHSHGNAGQPSPGMAYASAHTSQSTVDTRNELLGRSSKTNSLTHAPGAASEYRSTKTGNQNQWKAPQSRGSSNPAEISGHMNSKQATQRQQGVQQASMYQHLGQHHTPYVTQQHQQNSHWYGFSPGTNSPDSGSFNGNPRDTNSHYPNQRTDISGYTGYDNTADDLYEILRERSSH